MNIYIYIYITDRVVTEISFSKTEMNSLKNM